MVGFKEYNAVVTSVRDPSPELRVIRFRLDSAIAFTPGQFVQVLIEGIPKPASFSIASSPLDDELEIAFHRVGRVTGAMKMMVPGSKCVIRGPLGRFTFSADDGDIICLAGGVGITPFMSFARYVRDLRLPNKVTIFYSAKNLSEMIYYDELKEISESFDNINVVFTITREIPDGWDGPTRRIDEAMIKSHEPYFKERIFYVCGPKVFIESMTTLCKSMGVAETKIRRELW